MRVVWSVNSKAALRVGSMVAWRADWKVGWRGDQWVDWWVVWWVGSKV